MIELIIVNSFGSTMFTVKVEVWIAVAIGDKIYLKEDSDGNPIGRAVDWEVFKNVIDESY